MAFFPAEGGGDAGGGEHGHEGVLPGIAGALPFEALDLVVGDAVDLGFHFARHADEGGGVLGAVVDAGDEDVFKGQPLLFPLGVKGAGLEEHGERVFAVHGHDLRADLIGGAVEGDGEADLEGLLGEFADLRGEAAGGKGDVARAEADAPGGIDDADGAHEVGEVREGLAHAHEDDVIDALAAQLLDAEDLPDDLGGGEIAAPAVEPARAEFAAVGAADLGGNAERAPVAGFAVKRGRRGDEH